MRTVEEYKRRSLKLKAPEMGCYFDGKVYVEPVPKAGKRVLHHVIKFTCTERNDIVTGGWYGYKGLSDNCEHTAVDHHRGECATGGYRTNFSEAAETRRRVQPRPKRLCM